VLATTDHALLKLSSIFGHDVFNSELLEISSGLEVFDEDLVSTEVPYCFVKLVVLTAHFHHIVD